MKSYPIWVETQNDAYSSGGHRYGIRNSSTATVYVGSSRINSHEFATFEKIYEQLPCGTREFQLLLDMCLQPLWGWAYNHHAQCSP